MEKSTAKGVKRGKFYKEKITKTLIFTPRKNKGCLKRKQALTSRKYWKIKKS